MNAKIETLRIVLDLNLPRPTKVYLTKNLFYFPPINKTKGGGDEPTHKSEDIAVGGAVSNYPLFTFDAKYAVDKLQSAKSSKMRIEYFFNSNLFAKLLRNQPIATTEEEKHENAKYNIMCMFGCFFPTSFPTKYNIQSSFDANIEKNTSTNSEFTFDDENGSSFSYIRLVSGIYTVTRLTWINDIINDTTYRYLLNEIIKYNKWEIQQKETLKKKIHEQQANFKKLRDEFVKRQQSAANITRQLDNPDIKKYIRSVTDSINFSDALPKIKDQYAFFFGNVTEIKDYIPIVMKIKESTDKMPRDFLQFLPSEFDKIYNSAKEISIDIQTLDAIENPNKINPQNKALIQKLKEYSDLQKIISIVRTFIEPYRKTSNPGLQSLIKNFVFSDLSEMEKKKRKEKELNIRDFATYVENTFLSKNTSSAKTFSNDLLDIGIVMTNLPYIDRNKKQINRARKLDVRAQLDVFKGIMNESNIKCIHRGTVVEATYNSLKKQSLASNPSELDKIRLYLDINSISQKKGGKSRKLSSKKMKKTRKQRNSI